MGEIKWKQNSMHGYVREGPCNHSREWKESTACYAVHRESMREGLWDRAEWGGDEEGR